MTTTIARTSAVEAFDVWKSYGSGERRVTALRSVSVDIRQGELTAIVGPAGSGKTTLMHCLAGLDAINRGHLHVNCATPIGFVFQQVSLLRSLTVGQNILLPLTIAEREVDPDWYRQLLATTRLTGLVDQRPAMLTAGQQQRVACARALIAQPDLVFADEPSAEVVAALREAVTAYGRTVVIMTRSAEIAAPADRLFRLAAGSVDQLS